MVSIPFLDGTTEKGAASCCHVTGLHRGAGDEARIESILAGFACAGTRRLAASTDSKSSTSKMVRLVNFAGYFKFNERHRSSFSDMTPAPAILIEGLCF